MEEAAQQAEEWNGTFLREFAIPIDGGQRPASSDADSAAGDLFHARGDVWQVMPWHVY